MGIPQAWDATLNTGVGQSAIGTLWITGFLHVTAFFHYFGFSWNLILLFSWILPAIIFGFLGAYHLFSYLFQTKRLYRTLAGIIYLCNIYFLLLLFGGQLGVILAYALTPFVVLYFIKLLKEQTFFGSVLFSLVLSLQVLFDPRFVYIALIILGGYFLWEGFLRKINLRLLFFIVFIPGLIVLLLHNYWIVPLLVYKAPALPQSFDSTSGFRFFSFAIFSNALGLLHPNWPDNIFGKVSFMKPEFLVLPMLAYASLLFINVKRKTKNVKQQFNSTNKTILFFALLGLIGAFLAKGAQDPFGSINIFLFEYVQGMQMFRDPTKFYTIIAVAYSILIPYSLFQISKILSAKCKTKKYVTLLPTALFIIYLLFLLQPVFFNQIGRVLMPRVIPQEYVQLKDFLENEESFSRTLWIPQWQRYGYFSHNHPAIGRGELVKQQSSIVMAQKLRDPKTQNILKEFGVKYIIVPFDSEGEIFLDDRKYDEKTYRKIILEIEKNKEIKKVKTFGKIVVFEISLPRDHFWSPKESLVSQYKFIKPTEYEVSVKDARKGDVIVFSESFDFYWFASESNSVQIQSKNNRGVNSFVLSKNGDYMVKVFYKPQRWVHIGLWISLITLLFCLGSLIFLKKR